MFVTRSCELKLQEMIDAKEIILRSMDSRKNYQPEHLSWCVHLVVRDSDPRTEESPQEPDGAHASFDLRAHVLTICESSQGMMKYA